MKRILIIGATSAIAQECARIWSGEHARFYLVARNEQRLKEVARDLEARGATNVETAILDVAEMTSHQHIVERAQHSLEQLDIVLLAHGVLPDEAACDQSPSAATAQFTINATATISLMIATIAILRKQGAGTLAVISSVAGDRGRASNCHYGAAKAAVSTFSAGMRARLRGTGVSLVTIKPGMVDTPMTSGMPLPRALVSSPDSVARAIVRGIDRKVATIYAPWWWRWIMLVIRHIPESIFVRLKL